MANKEKLGFDGMRPVLSVENISKSIKYYVDTLGFSLNFAWDGSKLKFLDEGEEGKVDFAQVGFGAALIMLCEKEQGQPGMWIHLDLNSADKLNELHEKWREAGAKITETPSVRPWGTYEMRLEDMDGHTFRISSPLAKS